MHDVGVVDGRPYLVMDLIAGQRLTDVIAMGPLDEERVIAIGAQVADALHAAHRSGLVHRDVKPDNILITPDGVARVIDFGLAARTTDGHDDAIAGTLAYTAPEQSGMLKRPVDGRADLYALGAVLLECATGAPPFAADDVGELLRKHVATPAPDARSRRPELAPALSAIIGKLLAKDPDDRYQTGAGLAADLRRLPVDGLILGQLDEPAAAGYEPALIGRDRELAALCEGWDRARRGRGGLALIQGAPGTGKSRLAREVAARARRDGQVTLRTVCGRDDSTPLAPLRAAVDQYLQTVERLPVHERDEALRDIRAAAGEAGALLKKLSPQLGRLLDAPDLDDERQDQLTAAAATFLTRLARSLGGMLLCLDDVQWLDEPSRRVLDQLVPELPDAALFIVATIRTDDESLPALEQLRAGLGEAVTVPVSLPALDSSATRQLVAAITGDITVPDELVTLLAERSAGNPFVLLEYLAAVIDAGVIRPCWGAWLADADRLGSLQLPDDAVDLVVKRLDALDARSRHVLTVGAVFGGRFALAPVGQVCGEDTGAVFEIATAAIGHRLVERRPDDEYGFVHERIRSELLAGLDRQTLQQLHARVADVIECAGATGPEQVYALAHHVIGAGTGQPLDRVVRVCAAAGQQALRDQGASEAVRLLEYALTALTADGSAPDCLLLQSLGVAYQRSGCSAEALATFELARDTTADRFERAAILHMIARCHANAGHPDRTLTAAHLGLAEFGRPLRKTAAGRGALALWLFTVSLLISITGLGRGTLRGTRRDRHSLLASLYHAGADGAARTLQPLKTLMFLLLQRYHIVRVGDCPAAPSTAAGVAMLAQGIRMHRRADRMIERAVATGVRLADPRSVAEVHWLNGIGQYGNGLDLGGKVRWAIEEHGRWLETGMYLEGVSQICWDHLSRGEVADAEVWQRRGAARTAGAALADGHPFLGVSPAIHAMRGRFAEAATQLNRLRGVLADEDFFLHMNLMQAVSLNAMEQGDLDVLIGDVGTALARLQPATMKIMTHFQDIAVFHAYGLVEAARTAPRECRTERIAAAREAVTALGKVVTRPLTRAHHVVLTAALHQLSGDNEAALRRLANSDVLLRRVDAPLVSFEAARVRARALPHSAERGRLARYALSIAVEQGWPHRARWLKTEFSVSTRSASNDTNHTRTGTSDSTQTGRGEHLTAGIFRQRLSALEQVSQAASRVLDPDQLARIALDETVRILAAERALLFLCDPDTGTLRAHLGRDNNGTDLHELTNYSSTLIESVRDNREAMVLTGTEEGAALGAQSVVIHGLRSIMAAPLLLDDRLLGVVYLDSRVAKGIFTADDVGILGAITNHIAIAMETARAAQLELAVTTANQQRELAETMRDAMARLSDTLEPSEVLARLLATVSEVLTAEQVWLILNNGGHGAQVAAMLGGDAQTRAKLLDLDFSLDADPQLAQLLVADDPTIAIPGATDPVTFGFALQASGSWIAVPLATRDARIGMMLIASAPAHAYDDTQTRLAAALTSQGMVAYENARLFQQVRQLATVDGLTGVANRRHFYQVAAQQLAHARAVGGPLAAVMLDIDHFKRINDTYGHQIGDQVIQAVAERLRAQGRGNDLIGRYGGEEFAVLLQSSGTGATAAAERLRRSICDTPIDTAAGPLPVTISVGVADLTADQHDIGNALTRADEYLYRAKQAGRNQVSHGN